MASEKTSLAAESLNFRAECEKRLIAKAWEDRVFKQELLSNPKATIEKEFGQPIPEGMEIQVLEESPTTSYIVLSRKPAELEAVGELSDEALESVAGGKQTQWRISVSRETTLPAEATVNIKTNW